jgi:hypothetical protein
MIRKTLNNTTVRIIRQIGRADSKMFLCEIVHSGGITWVHEDDLRQ